MESRDLRVCRCCRRHFQPEEHDCPFCGATTREPASSAVAATSGLLLLWGCSAQPGQPATATGPVPPAPVASTAEATALPPVASASAPVEVSSSAPQSSAPTLVANPDCPPLAAGELFSQTRWVYGAPPAIPPPPNAGLAGGYGPPPRAPDLTLVALKCAEARLSSGRTSASVLRVNATWSPEGKVLSSKVTVTDPADKVLQKCVADGADTAVQQGGCASVYSSGRVTVLVGHWEGKASAVTATGMSVAAATTVARGAIPCLRRCLFEEVGFREDIPAPLKLEFEVDADKTITRSQVVGNPQIRSSTARCMTGCLDKRPVQEGKDRAKVAFTVELVAGR